MLLAKRQQQDGGALRPGQLARGLDCFRLAARQRSDDLRDVGGRGIGVSVASHDAATAWVLPITLRCVARNG